METLNFSSSSSSSLPKSPPFLTLSANYPSFNIISPLKKLYKRKSPLKFKKPLKENNTSNLPRKKQSLHEVIFKPLQDYVTTFCNSDIPPFLDPEKVLSGSLSPVEDELPPTACAVVEGSLPPCLDGGVYIQNGPNPQFRPLGPYIFADGDGMLQSLTISGGSAVFCSRFVKTFKYNMENELGHPIFPNIVSYFCSNVTALMAVTLARVLLGQFNPFVDGLGTANTSLALIGGGLHALMETDLPYRVEITPAGDIATVGRHRFGSGQGLSFLTMTAHPKIDPVSGEAFAFRYFVVPPFLTYFRIDAAGEKQKDVPIFSLKNPSYIHDFAVTENHAIFPDPQVVMKPFEILRGKPVLKIDREKTPRIGVIPKYAEDESSMYWIEEAGLNILHVVNAWEEDGGDRIVIVASNIMSVEHAIEHVELISLSMEEIVIDNKNRQIVSRRPLSGRSLDFGAINPRFSQRKSRYVYAAAMEAVPRMVGLVKMDMELPAAECTVACRMYGPGCYGSEPIFVPRGEVAAAEEEEDDGYLVTYVSNERTKETHFVVMDAKSPSLKIVAAVKLPRRVPQGFHSIFVRGSELQKI